MFKHIFINKLKVIINNKSMLFWNMIFPFILGTFFYIALGNVTEMTKFKVINLGVIDNQEYQEEKIFKEVINDLSKKGKNQIFDTKYLSLSKAKNLLKENEVSGYIEIVKGEPKLTIKDNGIEQTIIKSVVDEYYQSMSAVKHGIQYNPEIITNGIINKIQENKNYLKDESNEKLDFLTNYFFTLIAMTCLYASLIGVEIIKDGEANLSTKGARVSISPVNKFKMIIANLSAGFVVELVGLTLLFIYILYVLKIDLGNHLGYTYLIGIFGILAGLSLGTFVAVSNKKSEGFKTGFLIAIIMLFCFFSGMMGDIVMKAYFDETFPILSKINPINIITDGLYSLYAYDTLTVYFNCLTRIIIFQIVFVILSFIFIRRKKYDSI